MAVDRQQIINSLGQIVNQLQSADCGCLGNVFSNPNQGAPNCQGFPAYNANPGHQNNMPCSGEPYSGCHCYSGCCNPPKLFADTYNYLKPNLMQPVVQEVYEELKSINPRNTIMNNMKGAQMGLPAGMQNPGQRSTAPQNAMAGGAMGIGNNVPRNMHNHSPIMPHLHFGNFDTNANTQNSQGMGQGMHQGMGHGMRQTGQEMVQMSQNGPGVGGMEHNMDRKFVNREMGHGRGQMGRGMGGMNQGMGHQMHSSGDDTGMGQQIVNMMYGSSKQNYQQNQGGLPNATSNAIPQSPDIGQMPGDAHQSQFNPAQMQNTGYMGANSMPHGDNGMQGNQFMAQPNMDPGANMNAQGNAMSGAMKQTNSPPHRMGHTNNYGVHNAGMSKFNEMFSGMMKGDLGYDPMAIAIQMNPANEKRSAMNTMQKMMMSGDSRHNPRLDQLNNLPQAANMSAGLREMTGTQQQPGDATDGAPMQYNQQVYNAEAGAPNLNQQMTRQQMNVQDQQMQQKQQWQEPVDQVQQERYQQEMADPDSDAVISRPLPTVYEGYPNVRPQTEDTALNHLYREPIFPADTTRHLLQSHHFSKPQKFYDYNTLGQAVEVLPAKRYRMPIPDLPQTLSPAPEAGRYSNVKNTISKTALMGDKPEGKVPSRTQLQRVYNQYKGSQSFTQQNIKPNYTGASYSSGHIRVPADSHHPHPQQQVYIERFGGDTEANNRYPEKLDPNEENSLVAAKKADYYPVGKNVKLRNGLQDQVYTSGPKSTKWTFHGTGNPPFSVGYRYNYKMR